MHVYLLVWVILSSKFARCENCVQAKDYVCNQVPTGYPPGVTSLVFFISNMDEISTTVFNSTNLASVTSLTMTRCGITSIAPNALSHFRSLGSLNLHNNALSEVTSAWFTHRRVLQTLTITNNSIISLNDDSFRGFSGLSSLNLSQNLIRAITPGCFSSLISLRSLDLSNNNLSYLSPDVLGPLNNTRIHLSGNPWDCSCSVYKFASYLRELQEASLLQDEMDVLCMSPPHQRGSPVWKVSECLNPTTAADAPTSNGQLNPGGIKPPTLITLIVLYHRKHERKHLLTVQPSPVEQEGTKQSPTDSEPRHHKTNPNNTVLLQSDQTVLESEKASHIFQIYSTGPYPRREPCLRARSAGPEFFSVCGVTQMETSVREDLMDLHVDVMKDDEKVRSEISECEDKTGKRERNEKGPERTSEEHNDADDGNTGLKTVAILDLMMDADGMEENTMEESALQNISTRYVLKSIGDEAEDRSFKVSRTFQEENVGTIQLLDDGENIPYFTIGPDPENPKSVQNPALIHAEASRKPEKTRPVGRVQSWPPTAAQWKKHWSQNQEVLNVSPHLIFLTQYTYQVSTLPPSRPETFPHEHQSHVQVRDTRSLEPSRESSTRSSIRGSSTSAEDFASINDQSDPNDVPAPNRGAQSKSVTSSNPPREQTSVKGDAEDSVKIKNEKKKTNRTRIGSACERMGSRSGKRPWRTHRKGHKAEQKKPRNPPRSGSGPSGSCPSGCSPSDDHLLVGNEYTFIDLLHEVVENQGRWTRARWRQSHINKSKNKQPGKAVNVAANVDLI